MRSFHFIAAALLIASVSAADAKRRPVQAPVQMSACNDSQCFAGSTAAPVRRVYVKRDSNGIHRSARRGRAMTVMASADPNAGIGAVAAIGSDLVSTARRYIGGNPTGRSSLWCADFMNLVLARTGHKGTGTRMARDFERYGTRVSGPEVGAIAVMSRGRRGGHVGIVSGIDARGNPVIISGNHGRRVAEATYARGRVYAYVRP